MSRTVGSGQSWAMTGLSYSSGDALLQPQKRKAEASVRIIPTSVVGLDSLVMIIDMSESGRTKLRKKPETVKRCGLEIEGPCVLDLRHDERRQDAADRVYGSKYVDYELIVIFHIRSVDLEHIVILS